MVSGIHRAEAPGELVVATFGALPVPSLSIGTFGLAEPQSR